MLFVNMKLVFGFLWRWGQLCVFFSVRLQVLAYLLAEGVSGHAVKEIGRNLILL